ARLDSSRLEFAARNGGLSARVELDNIRAGFQVIEPLLLNPGESILVVRNEAAFISRYGAEKRIAGEYSGRLSNGGDRLILLGPMGEPILDFQYDPAWWPITDGTGFSLVAVDPAAPAANWGSPTNWRPSSGHLGSPGSLDPAPASVPPVLVNEAIAHPVPPDLDRIELFNPNPTNVNVGGWYLSDNFVQPNKFRIPDNTWIEPYGFAVFTETEFNPALPSGFGLNGEGDELWLFSADAAGQLTGYYHGFDFGPSDEGVSLGRYRTSQGHDHFVAQLSNSFTGTNTGPRVGPVVISEIMYWPPQTGGNTNDFLEFIELHNSSSAPVGLFSPNLPLRTWHLRDAVDYVFPPNVVLAPGERILVVGFNPADAAGLAAFRTAYPSATNVTLFGPWHGRLSNSDERIELRRPGQLTAAGDVPSVLVEAVHYHSAAPWAEGAAGQGSSLQRRLAAAYGNDPVNWIADGASPGATNTVNLPPAVTLTSPTNGQITLYPDGVWIQAAATDPDGSVTKMEFFANGISLGELTNAPYSLHWTNPPTGLHTLTAVARDNSGNFGFSTPVTITVTVPTLEVFIVTGGLDLAWPSNSGTFSVHIATNLAPPILWTPLNNSPTLFQNNWRLRLSPLTNQAGFYRLQTQ
ncbi:MAG TPA: lamin tail domain-containing protein, partial [Clostridia bacterium]|nr:lamin tail domain-containing protein [Clostridia bacterium]